MNRAVVLGTNHSVQRGEFQKNDFHSFLISLCQKENIKSIAEEIDGNAKLIVAKTVCNQLSINHLIIEPNPSDYQKLGITPYDRIRYEVMCIYDLDEAPSADNKSPVEALTEFESRIVSEHNLPREREWLNRIIKNEENDPEEESFADLFESYSAGMSDDLQLGDKISGKIISIGKDAIFLDIGTKVDGIVERAELLDSDGNLLFAEGDDIELLCSWCQPNEALWITVSAFMFARFQTYLIAKQQFGFVHR